MNDKLEFEDDGVPLSRLENERLLEEEKPTHKGVIVPIEDIKLDDNLAIYSGKRSDEIVPAMGQAFQVKAILLPYIIGNFYTDPDGQPITVDARFLNFMRVDEAYIKAQSGTTKRKRGPQQ